MNIVVVLAYLAVTVMSACGLGIGLRLTLKTREKPKKTLKENSQNSFHPIIHMAQLSSKPEKNSRKKQENMSSKHDFSDTMDRLKSFLEGGRDGGS